MNQPIKPLAKPEEVGEVMGLTVAELAQMRYTGRGPKYVKVTGRQVRYRWEDVQQWLDERTRRRTDGLAG